MPKKLKFRVIHVSGQDDAFPASELNYHSPVTKGWQASRFCLYPQDIVIQFDQRARLRKIQILSHQYLIATKIEFFVGDVAEGSLASLDNARYARLGYVSLSDNEKTGYKARELKSVHVDAVGTYLKLNIHKNHINKFNLYNSVGIVAINVIGDEIKDPLDFTGPEYGVSVGDNRGLLEKDPMLDGPDYISPIDDLAFDMYQDPEIANIIRKLERKKQKAVMEERYDYAKKLKQIISDLQKAGEKLGKMEIEKRQAVENEDYDKAKAKKDEMDEYRLQIYKGLNLNDVMETPRQTEGFRQPTPPPMLEDIPKTPSRENTPSPSMPYEDRPLPGIKKYPIEEDETVNIEAEEQVMPGEPEPMTEKDLREASAAIEVFGHALVSKAYSKTWSYREDALLAVYKQMQELPPTSKDDAKSMLRAAIFLIKKGIDDLVHAVFQAALKLLKMILTEFIPKHKIPRPETAIAVERTVPNLLYKTGDTAARHRDEAKKFIIEESSFQEVKPTHVVAHECVKPIKLPMAPRLAQSRVEVVEMLYNIHGLKNSGMNIDNIMTFCVQALQHNASEVRLASERIIKALYKDVGEPVKDYLPPDDEKTRKSTMWRQLFEYFDKVDGKPSKSDQKKQKNMEETKKKAEIDALQRQLQDLKNMQSGKVPVDQNLLKDDKKKIAQKKVTKQLTKPKAKAAIPNDNNDKQPVIKENKKLETKKSTKPKAATGHSPKPQDDDAASTLNINRFCIFCAEKNDEFTEEGLDVHYWKNCPMLKRCANCKQVVEISTFTDHLLTECDAKGNFAKCPRCSEAILKTEYDRHVQEKSCNATKKDMNHCPLCHMNIASGEDGWKNHLMGKDGCKQNPRRLLALNKVPAGKTSTQSTGPKKLAARSLTKKAAV